MIMKIFYSPTLVAQQKERKIDEKMQLFYNSTQFQQIVTNKTDHNSI